ncbi:MAG: hypothetical protein WCE90_01510 [Candidatus Zixiibacteriota bacterium]
MRFYRSLKLSVIFVFLFVSFSLWHVRAEQKTNATKDSVTRTEKPIGVSAGKSDSTASVITDSLGNALDDFHQILAPLWHEAFPKKLDCTP